MKSRFLLWAIICVFFFSLITPVSAQENYSFQVTREMVHVYLNADGSMSLDYLITFVNDPGAHIIDFVDLGLPNSNYDFGSITADVDSVPVAITSDYQGNGTGVAVNLGQKAIKNKGTVHVFVSSISKMFYPDKNDKDYASSEFAPTYFSPQFVHGTTALTVVFHLPPGVKPNETKYHAVQGSWPGEVTPQIGFDSEQRITYTWASSQANASTQYTFGASFPKSYIPASSIVTTSVWSIVSKFISNIKIFPFLVFCFIFFVLPMFDTIGQKKRKLQYIKPSIAIEGHGIKRGLTAVEAAILMGQPLDKVMTMILFSTTKKGALQVITRDPLKVEAIEPQPKNLLEYEKDFLSAMLKPKVERAGALKDMTVALVKNVTAKMKGFSRNETLEYYQFINEKAWQQVSAAGTPEVKAQLFEESFEWTMLDKDYDDRSRKTFTGPVYVPTWWGRYDPVYRPVGFPQMSSSGMAKPSSSQGGRVSLPGADFAASVVGGVQNFSGQVLGNLNDFTHGVTNVTNPVPPSSGSGGSGRSGGGCACACAGCACACAGGGR